MREFTDEQYVLMHLAKTCGKDKQVWNNRLSFARNLLEMDKKVAMLSAKDVPDLGEFTIDMDATASCLQLYSILTGCRKTAEESNVLNTGECRDVYVKCTDNLNEKLGTDFAKKVVKYAVMPTFYASVKQPMNLVGKKNIATYVAMLTELLPGACIGLQEIQNSWRSDVLAHSWFMEDGFHVVVPVTSVKEVLVTIEEWDVQIPYRYTVEEAQAEGINLAANAIQSVDGYVVREVVRKADFPVWPIHDCFRAKAKNMNALRAIVIDIYYAIAKSNMFSDIINQIRGTTDYCFTKMDDIAEEILDSEYIIC